MLAYGGMLLVWGLSDLGDPQAALRLPSAEVLPPAKEEMLRDLLTANAGVIAAHRPMIRARAVATLALALLMLYAAAATLSRDRLGRGAALCAGWLGIAYQLGTLPLSIPLAAAQAHASAPILARRADLLQQAGDATPLSPETVDAVARWVLVGVWVALAVVGVAGSIVVIAYFGGRRGRMLYGLPPARGSR
jgi:hypothetical protein